MPQLCLGLLLASIFLLEVAILSAPFALYIFDYDLKLPIYSLAVVINS
jgi:hypothetical protein